MGGETVLIKSDHMLFKGTFCYHLTILNSFYLLQRMFLTISLNSFQNESAEKDFSNVLGLG